MVGVLRLFQGGMGAAGHLPDDILEQPSAMVEALTMMAGFEARLADKDGPPVDEDGDIDRVEAERRAAASWGVAL